jgi:hypothetical protein
MNLDDGSPDAPQRALVDRREVAPEGARRQAGRPQRALVDRR